MSGHQRPVLMILRESNHIDVTIFRHRVQFYSTIRYNWRTFVTRIYIQTQTTYYVSLLKTTENFSGPLLIFRIEYLACVLRFCSDIQNHAALQCCMNEMRSKQLKFDQCSRNSWQHKFCVVSSFVCLAGNELIKFGFCCIRTITYMNSLQQENSHKLKIVLGKMFAP